MNVKLVTQHHLEFLSLKGGCTGSSEPTLVKMPHCRKSHVTAQIFKLNSLYAGLIFMLLLWSFFNFFKKFFPAPSVSNVLDSDQDCPFVDHDLDPNCLERLSADDKNCL